MRRLSKRERIIANRRRYATVTIWFDADALERWQASGKGWQTRAAEVLAKYAPRDFTAAP